MTQDLNPRLFFHAALLAGTKLCLLPVGRVSLERPVEISPGFVLYPAGHLTREDLRVVSVPEEAYEEAWRRYGTTTDDGQRVLEATGEDLAWLKSHATQVTAEAFFNSALLGFTIDVNWDRFLGPTTHADHLSILEEAMACGERVFDLVRFHYCNPFTTVTLPGKVGLLSPSQFSAGLFYALEDHESYIIAGEVITHQIVVGLGLEIGAHVSVEPLAHGEVGHIARQGLMLYTQALEASTETAKFIQLMNLIEFLAEPDRYQGMADAKRAIGRHVAKDLADYEAIMEDFKYLSSRGGVSGPNDGLRHNIVHVGKRLETLIGPEERIAVFKRLARYVCVPLGHMMDRSASSWGDIEAFRYAAGEKLGF
ncbi:hypothetical protein GCM10011273_18730 [Asticcacaulis endophyticus]|uniref:Uncharacterized protein n=2 Tax=Asticcacaulis endophyticus TaxID=1395890 RepID=A0A918Q3Q9_9CAUL|nr:hypothetical protein GCM10011273_18730 [Asticcacaulis endophyticus]